MRKLNKKQVQKEARAILLDLIKSEVDNPSEILTWEELPELDEEGFEASYFAVYEELSRIHSQLKKRWIAS